MDTEDGWRVMQGPLVEELIASNPQLYLSSPKLEPPPNEIDKDFLNSDEEFRIKVADLKPEEGPLAIEEVDSLPVASSLVSTPAKQLGKKAPMLPLKKLKPPLLKEDNMDKNRFFMRNNAILPTYSPQKFIREPLMDRFPYYDMQPENTNLRDYQLLSQLDDPIHLPSFEYRTAPKFLPYRPIMPILDNSVEYYEIEKNVRPIILKEEISYEDTPTFGSSRFRTIPQKMMFPSASMMQKPYFKGPPLPISVKTVKIMKKPKRSMRTFSSSSSRGIPIVRGRFRI